MKNSISKLVVLEQNGDCTGDDKIDIKDALKALIGMCNVIQF